MEKIPDGMMESSQKALKGHKRTASLDDGKSSDEPRISHALRRANSLLSLRELAAVFQQETNIPRPATPIFRSRINDDTNIPMTSPNPGATNQTELERIDNLIRAGSTLLSILQPVQDLKGELIQSKSEQRMIQLLDRLAILLVSRESLEVTCVMARHTAEVYQLFRMQDSPSETPELVTAVEEVYSISNSHSNRQKNYPTKIAPGKVVPTRKWLDQFLRKSVHSALRRVANFI
jgi:hypothetical protein